MFLSREQVRTIDRRAIEEYGIPGVVLMENAGHGTADLLQHLGIHGTVIVCCGKGNNGGDGFVIARHLDGARVPVRVLLFGQPNTLTGDAAANHRILVASGVPLTVYADPTVDVETVRGQLADADWVVDALFGTGLRGPVKTPFDCVIQAMNESGKHMLAVDIPSGLDCDTGQPLGPTIQAAHTATFVASKKGFAEPAAARWLGQVHVLPIGVPRKLLQEFMPDP